MSTQVESNVGAISVTTNMVQNSLWLCTSKGRMCHQGMREMLDPTCFVGSPLVKARDAHYLNVSVWTSHVAFHRKLIISSQNMPLPTPCSMSSTQSKWFIIFCHLELVLGRRVHLSAEKLTDWTQLISLQHLRSANHNMRMRKKPYGIDGQPICMHLGQQSQHEHSRTRGGEGRGRARFCDIRGLTEDATFRASVFTRILTVMRLRFTAPWKESKNVVEVDCAVFLKEALLLLSASGVGR